MYIIKASGQKEQFNPEKLAATLQRVGVKQDQIEQVITKVEHSLSRQPTSQEVIRRALALLQQTDAVAAARYNLKRAIMNLGPTGFPFEQYISRLLEAYGYKVQTNVRTKGLCVNHELDVVAKKDKRHIMIECKYHNTPGIRSDVKVTLYTWARFLDIKKAWDQSQEHLDEFHEAWLVTNTKCTHDAIQYARCAGLYIVSWRYPENNSLEELIDKKRIYPVTILLKGNKMIFSKLIRAGFLLAAEVAQSSLRELSKRAGLQERLLVSLYQEAVALNK
ncbi:MAG: restriction endonuclease [Patescibacteria group bacterium]